jgi:hypothetical protein
MGTGEPAGASRRPFYTASGIGSSRRRLSEVERTAYRVKGVGALEEKKRTLLAVVISCIILLAVVYSFGLNFFRSTPEIVVADPDVTAGQSIETGDVGQQGSVSVEVTPETVRSIIARMTRYKQYSRTIEIQYSWSGGTSEVITAQVQVADGWSRCDTTLIGGTMERSIVGEDTLWYWYDDSETWLECPADSDTQDLLQHIPTYEDVLELDQEQITDTGYEEKNGEACVYVEVEPGQAGTLDRYWISVSSGLLVCAETEQDGLVVYTMSSSNMVSPLAGADNAFTLPDGTVLYTAEG